MGELIIKKITIDIDDDWTGVDDISYVYNPANEENFHWFSADDKYLYTASPEPEIIQTSHEFCKSHAGKVYTLSQINNFNTNGDGFINDSTFFKDFNGNQRNNKCSDQLFNCRHKLVRVQNQKMSEDLEPDFGNTKFSSVDEERREVVGCVLQSNKLIYRDKIGYDEKSGYVYCDRDTIRNMFKKYGWKKNITFKHDNSRNINNDIIKLDTWLEENEEIKQTKWMEKHKIVSDKLWNQIKSGYVRGFSVNLNYKIV